MAVHTLFPTGLTLSAVNQTLTRLANVVDYVSTFAPPDADVAQHTGLWQEAVRDGDTDRLIEDIRTYDALPIRHLDGDSLEMLRQLALSDPQLRSALQANAEQLERSIGVSLPLRMTILTENTEATWPERGLALYLGSHDEAPLTASSSLQLFAMAAQASGDSSGKTFGPRKLAARGHSPAVRAHVSREDIERIAARDLTGARVTPLASPLEVALREDITRVGRLTFLGLNRADTDREELFSSLERYQNQVDVLALGGLCAAAKSFAEEAIVTLKPRVALLPARSAAAVHHFGYTTVFPVTPRSPTVLEFHPILQRVDLKTSRTAQAVALKKQNRFLDILEKIRPDVTRDLVRSVYGEMVSREVGERSKGAWRWARLTMNGVVPMALRYLLLLDLDPNRFSSVPEREEALMRLIDEMTVPLGFQDSAPDHVWAFKELLLRSGLLQPQA